MWKFRRVEKSINTYATFSLQFHQKNQNDEKNHQNSEFKDFHCDLTRKLAKMAKNENWEKIENQEKMKIKKKIENRGEKMKIEKKLKIEKEKKKMSTINELY